jgi:hypothetical protein
MLVFCENNTLKTPYFSKKKKKQSGTTNYAPAEVDSPRFTSQTPARVILIPTVSNQ